MLTKSKRLSLILLSILSVELNVKLLINCVLRVSHNSIKISDLEKSKTEGILNAVKYYPPGATTNSNMGVKNLLNCEKVLNWLQNNNIPLLLHGEVVDEDVDIYDREKVSH